MLCLPLSFSWGTSGLQTAACPLQRSECMQMFYWMALLDGCSPALSKVMACYGARNCFVHSTLVLISSETVFRIWSCLHCSFSAPSGCTPGCLTVTMLLTLLCAIFADLTDLDLAKSSLPGWGIGWSQLSKAQPRSHLPSWPSSLLRHSHCLAGPSLLHCCSHLCLY